MGLKTLGAARKTKKSSMRTVKVRFPNGQFRGATVIAAGSSSGVKLRYGDGTVQDNVAVATTLRGSNSTGKYTTHQDG